MLLFLILLNSVGYLPLYYLNRAELREAMRENISKGSIDSQLSIIAVNSNDQDAIIWLEDDEIEFKGDRYDVVKKETKENMTFYHVIHDGKEQGLTAAFTDHVKGQNDTKAPSKASMMIKLMLKEYQPANDLFVSYYNQAEKAYHPVSCGNTSAAAIHILTPPPEA